MFGVAFESYTEAHFRTTGPAGELMLAIAACIAKQERIRLSERTVAGLERARKHGRIGGRPRVITDRHKVAKLRAAGKSLGEIAVEMGLSKTTVARIAREATA